MQDNSYVTFSFNKLFYTVPTLTVQEIFLLPEITTIPESPPDIIGVINVRGTIVPVMDLNLRFGYAPINFNLTDSIIILNWQELKVAILVNEVYEVRNISPDEITSQLSCDQYFDQMAPQRFIAGFASNTEHLFTLLNVESLLQYIQEQNITTTELETEEQTEAEPLPKLPVFWPNATTEERLILQTRAAYLKEIKQTHELTNIKPLSVVMLGEELFGIELKLVREFTEISKVTPIPCTPYHIIGNMNLRGEILTLIDLSGFFNLPTSRIRDRKKAMVVQVDDITVGITVDGIKDVALLDGKTIMEVPTTHAVNKDYLQGIAPYQDKMLSILNLEEILNKGGLIVEETV